MKHCWKEILRGMGSTMDLWPEQPQPNIPQDRTERLRRSWLRTGLALSQAIGQAEREQKIQESSATSH
jgi:hypothetical protein